MQQKSSKGVQQHEVDAAADALLAEQMRPTVERVRMKIGRGSPNTVGPMLETWFASLAPRLGVAPATEGEAAGPPAAVRQAMDQIWVTALDGARATLEDTLRQGRDALETQSADLRKALDEHERQRAAVAQQEATLREALTLAKAQVNEQTQRITQLQADLTRSEQERSAARESLSGLVQERDADRRRFDEQLAQQADLHRRAEERAAAGERRLHEEVDRSRQDAKQAKRELADALRAHAQELKGLEQTKHALDVRLRDAEIQVASLRERFAAAEARTADLQKMFGAQREAPSGPRPAPRKAATRARRPTQK